MIVLTVAIVTGCGGEQDRVVVFAASSLTDVFDRLEDEFEAAEPDVDIVVTTGGSSSLVAQLIDGAPVDVLATADRVTMERAVEAASIRGTPVELARNELVIAVENGNPLGLDELGDLADGPVVVIAAPEVPAGAYAEEALDCAGVAIEPASYEPNVRAVVSKVALGEADAGLVYSTDIDDRVDALELPIACRVLADYEIVAVSDGDATGRFMAFVAGPSGDGALLDAGFDLP